MSLHLQPNEIGFCILLWDIMTIKDQKNETFNIPETMQPVIKVKIK